MALSSISAAVLVGGRSRRMGTPKALLRLDGDGDTLIERTVTTLREVAEDIVLVGDPVWPVPEAVSSCRLAVDRGTSAADGIVTALEVAQHRICIVVACDMPFLDAGLLLDMARMGQEAERGVIAIDAHGAHPLHAVWDCEQLPRIRVDVERGKRSLATLARKAGALEFDLDAPGRTECQRWSVFNVNTPGDLEVARAHAGTSR